MASPYPLYNTTYTLHRLSPLHAFPPLTNPSAFTPHAKSLLSILRGNVLRGVRIANDDDESLGRAGRLKNVLWTPLVSPTQWRQDRQSPDEEDPEPSSDPRGVMVEIIYEKASYTSLLVLPTPSTPQGEFTSLPLLLTRLPKSLRETLLNYLETTFDTTALPLPLDSVALQRLLERWLDTVLQGEEAGKDIQIVFSAPSPGSSLKAITMTIMRDDVLGFYQRGRKLLGDGEEGGVFFEALRHYAQGTMGLDIAALKVMKIACGGFVLGVGTGGGAGKVKVFAPRGGEEEEKAAEGVVAGLVEASLVAALR